VKPHETVSLRGYDLTFEGMRPQQGPNYTAEVGLFTVHRGGQVIGTMQPAKRSFPARETQTSETALLTRGVSQLYLALGDTKPDGSVVVRLYHKPLVLLIWLGACVMFVGGGLSL